MSNKIIIALFFLIAFSCKKDDKNVVPDVYVDFYIDVNSTQYLDLNGVGGYVYVTGGVNGIIIRRNDIDQFVAFDRTCTFHPDENRRIIVEDMGLYANDSACGSRFLLLDGSPTADSKSQIPLKQYRTAFDMGTGLLHVYNK